MKELRIIFMGTPEFAIPSLDVLVKNNYQIVGVITALDKPKGRGQILTPSPVKKYAIDHKIPVLQPKNLKNPDFIEELRNFHANLQVVVAFRMLPEIVWSMPELGTFNLHASLLPQYRGAAPINWAIIHGEKRTGLTTFFIKQEIDTGNILLQEEEPIFKDDNAGSLHDRLMMKGADIVLRTVRLIEEGDITFHKQEEIPGLKLAPKISREMCEIDWNKKCKKIHNFVRGMSPYPAAWMKIKGKNYKVFRVSIAEESKSLDIGKYNTDYKRFLHVQCADGLIAIEEWQPEGKKKMKIEDFFRGNTL